MPDISKIKIITQTEDESCDVKDAKLRDALDILLGNEKESSEE